MLTLDVLSPKHRPPTPIPRRWLLVLGVAVTLLILADLTHTENAASGLATLVALVTTLRIAGWCEQRLYVALFNRGAFTRVLAHLLLIPGGVVAGAMVSAVLGRVLTGFVPAVPVVFGLFVSLASVGTVLVTVVDLVISATVSGFRTRVALAMGSIVGAVVVLCLGIAELAAGLSEALNGGEISGLKISGAPFTREELFQWLRAPQHAVAAVFALALLFLLPALASAAVKFADAVMDRIRPLEGAFARVGSGDRRVRLEVGGSTEFKSLARSFNEMVERMALAERMERAFGVYVSGHVLEKIRAQHGEAALPPALKQASVFFADIRGFTSMSERLSPDEVVAFLNRYFEHAVGVISAHEGYLNKFIGDALVVVFNGPIEQPDHAERAVKCAIALQRKVAELNAQNAFPEVGQLQIGVGVSTGPMTCGNVGSARQMEYTVIGDTVNLAARLTSTAAPGEVLVSAETARLLPAEYGATPLSPIKVKGKQAEVIPSRVPVMGAA